jgi:hypothetical protein
MANRFTKHYTRDEARELLPQVKLWLARISCLRADLDKWEKKLAVKLEPGLDLGGTMVNQWVRVMAEINEVFYEFHRREIQIKDLDRGLIDFPAFIGGREVFLCWEQDEEDIEFWHDLDTGYAGRERI